MLTPSTNFIKIDGLIQRPGWDHDPVKPWQWCDAALSGPHEIVSYPIPAKGRAEIDRDATIMIRLMPGDPSSIKEVPLRRIACFAPDRHDWWGRTRLYYGPNEFIFTD